MRRRDLLLCLLVAAPIGSLSGQGSLDRSPNLSGDWVVRPGTVQFNFLHRFVRSPGPVRKVSNFPTFLLATSVVRGSMLGFNYSTNSTLAPAYPNEWEFFGRIAPWTEAGGFPLDVGAQVGWNLAADGLDGELSVSRRLGPTRLIMIGRSLTDPAPGRGDRQWAFGGGIALRVRPLLSLTGDYARLTDLARARGERAAWSAGLAIGIPGTPHTLSLHATNTSTGTLQGASRGGTRVRYGFEFTIPITLARYFGHRPTAPAPPPLTPVPSPGSVPTGPVTGLVVRSGMNALQFINTTIDIAAGTTIEWKNQDPLAHSVTADDGGFDSGSLEGGQVWRFTFTRPGTYTFHCTPHPFMGGTITVR